MFAIFVTQTMFLFRFFSFLVCQVQNDVASLAKLKLKSCFVCSKTDEQTRDRDMKWLQSGYCTYSEQPAVGSILIKSSLVHWAGQEAHQRLKVSRVLMQWLLRPCVFTAWLTDSTWLGWLTCGESSVTQRLPTCAQALKTSFSLSPVSGPRWTQSFWVRTLLTKRLQRAGGEL